LNLKNSSAYYDRGFDYDRLGNYKQAINDFNIAIKLNPKDATAYNKRGIAYYKLRNYHMFIQDFEMTAKLGNPDAQSYLTSHGTKWQ
jgi:tetratricopeptide (TPR) repeat protein